MGPFPDPVKKLEIVFSFLSKATRAQEAVVVNEAPTCRAFVVI